MRWQAKKKLVCDYARFMTTGHSEFNSESSTIYPSGAPYQWGCAIQVPIQARMSIYQLTYAREVAAMRVTHTTSSVTTEREAMLSAGASLEMIIAHLRNLGLGKVASVGFVSSMARQS